MHNATLVKHQTKTYGPKIYTQGEDTYKLMATVRYDDECGNGHNSFAITGAQYRKNRNGSWSEDSFGCLHEKITKHFPALAPFIKWHGMSSDEPMHYIANTVYHALEHGPKSAWVSYDGGQDPMKVLKAISGHDDIHADLAKLVEGKSGYTVKWDETSAKTRNLDHARSSAVWPDATDEDLTAPWLEIRLRQRLPKLMEEFKAAVESLGLTY